MSSDHREVPVFLDADAETLFGVLTTPAGAGNGLGVILLSGGDDIPSTNRNRVWVRVARRLAALGYEVLRLDYRGVGESTGGDNGYSLERPAAEDLDAAMAWFQERGVSDLILGGSCFGARTCLARAATSPGVRGLALVSSPVVRTNPIATDMPFGLFVKRMRRRKPIRGLLRFDNPRLRANSKRIVATGLRLAWSAVRARARPTATPEWASGDFVEAVVSLPRRGVPVLIVYGDSEPDYHEFVDVTAAHGDRLSSHGRDQLRLVILPGEVHAFADVELQEKVEDEVVDFLQDLHDRRLVAAP